MIDSAAAYLGRHVDLVNNMNVFPVPDGDTGTNMLNTLNGIRNRVRDESCFTLLPNYLNEISKAGLYEGRGNSGIIFSQIIQGFALEFTKQKITCVYDQSFCAYPTPLHPDALSILSRVKREGFKIGLISNTGMTPGRTVRSYMDKVGILQFFNVLVFSDEVHIAKPAKEIFDLALNQMGASPAQAVHVGDDRVKDVAAAKIAGLKAIWVPRFVQDQLPTYFPPDASVEDLADVVDAIIALRNP